MTSAAAPELEKVLERVSFLEKNVNNLEGWLRENFGYLRHLNFGSLRLTDSNLEEATPVPDIPEGINETETPPTTTTTKPKVVTSAEPIPITITSIMSLERAMSRSSSWVINSSTTSNDTIRNDDVHQNQKTNKVAANITGGLEENLSTEVSSIQVQGVSQEQVQGQAVVEEVATSAGSNKSSTVSTTTFVTPAAEKRDPVLPNIIKNAHPAVVPQAKPTSIIEAAASNQQPSASEDPAEPSRMQPPKPADVVVTPTPEMSRKPHHEAAASENQTSHPPDNLKPKSTSATIEEQPSRISISEPEPREEPHQLNSSSLPLPESELAVTETGPQFKAPAAPNFLLQKPSAAQIPPRVPSRTDNIQYESDQTWTNSSTESERQNKQFEYGGNRNLFSYIPENSARQVYGQKRQLACKKCNATFDRQNSLDRHVHTVHKIFLCKSCSKGFDTRQQLMQHIESKHFNKMFKRMTSNKKRKNHGSNLTRDLYQSNLGTDDQTRETSEDTNQAVSSTTRSPNHAGQIIPVAPVFHNNFGLQSRPPFIPQSFRPQFPHGNFYRPSAPVMNFNVGGTQPLGTRAPAAAPRPLMPVNPCAVCSKPFASVRNLWDHMQSHN